MKRVRVKRGRIAMGLLCGAVIAAPALAQSAAPPVADAAPAANPVDINEFYVEGNTVLSPLEIERAVYPHVGPGKSLDDVEAARASLEKVYQAKGYQTVLVEVPQQTVRGGVVRLLVAEGAIGQVAVTGGKHMSDERVRRALPSLAEGRVPNLNTLNEELAALNQRSADRQVSPELKPGAAAGTIDVALAVEDKLPLHGSLELNNQYSRDTTKLRVQAGLRYEDLWGLGHSISAFYAVAPERPSDSEVIVLGYGAPITDRLRLDVTALKSNSDVATVAATNVIGDGQSVTAALTGEIASAPGTYQSWSASIAYKDFNERLRFEGEEDEVPITYFPVSLGYNFTRQTARADIGLNAALTYSFRGLGSTPVEFDNKRFEATGGFAYLNAGANIRHNLPLQSEIYVALQGQIASEPLVSNEQFATGGANSVRGYLQSEAIGDNGLRSTIELRSPSLSGLGDWLTEARAIGFVDASAIFLKNPLPDQDDQISLLGVGVGLRARVFDRLSGEVDLAVPLKDSSSTEAGDPRIHFRVSTDF